MMAAKLNLCDVMGYLDDVMISSVNNCSHLIASHTQDDVYFLNIITYKQT